MVKRVPVLLVVAMAVGLLTACEPLPSPATFTVTTTVDGLDANPATRRVAYLSAEFLMGPQLGANLLNLGIITEMRTALASLGFDMYAVLGHEEDVYKRQRRPSW